MKAIAVHIAGRQRVARHHAGLIAFDGKSIRTVQRRQVGRGSKTARLAEVNVHFAGRLTIGVRVPRTGDNVVESIVVYIGPNVRKIPSGVARRLAQQRKPSAPVAAEDRA